MIKQPLKCNLLNCDLHTHLINCTGKILKFNQKGKIITLVPNPDFAIDLQDLTIDVEETSQIELGITRYWGKIPKGVDQKVKDFIIKVRLHTSKQFALFVINLIDLLVLRSCVCNEMKHLGKKEIEYNDLNNMYIHYNLGILKPY